MPLKTNKYLILVSVFVLITYLLTLRGLPGNLHPNGVTESTKIQMNQPPFETSMERGRYAQVVSLAESGNLNVDEFYKFLKPDVAWYNDHFYSTFPPGTAILATPLYLVGRMLGLAQVFTYGISILFSIFTVVVIFKITQKLNLSVKTSILSCLIYAVGSMAFPYSVSLSAHPVSAFLLALGFLTFLHIDVTNNNLKHFLLLWFLFGINLFIDYPNLIIYCPLLIGGFIKTFKLFDDKNNIKPRLPYEFFAGTLMLLLVVCGFALYNLSVYGKPIAFANTFSIKFLETEGIAIEDVNLSNEMFTSKSYATRFSLGQTLTGIKTLLISSDRGLLTFFPVFLFAIYGLYVVLRAKNLYADIALAVIVLNVLVYAAYDDPWGGWAFGPRYLIVSTPILAVMCGIAFEHLTSKIKFAKIAFFVLLAFSTSIALLGAATTNAVPPSIEVQGTNRSDNYVINWKYLNSTGTSSFIYGGLLNHIITPIMYYGLIMVTLIGTEAWIVFMFRNPVLPQPSIKSLHE